jgi:putative salt-induced outer membrane protein YdiY
MKRFFYVMCLGFLFWVSAAEADWKNEVSLGLNYRSGNTEKSLYKLNVKSEKYSSAHDWLHSVYAEQGMTEALQTEGLVRFKSEYRLRATAQNYYGSLVVQGLHDAIRGVKLRAQFGPSYGYYFVQSDQVKIDASIGLNATDDHTILTHDLYLAYRLAGNINWKFNSQASLYVNGEVSGNVEEPAQDFQSLFVIGIKSAITDTVALHAELRDDYDHQPDKVGAKKNDLLITIGLTYNF